MIVSNWNNNPEVQKKVRFSCKDDYVADARVIVNRVDSGEDNSDSDRGMDHVESGHYDP